MKYIKSTIEDLNRQAKTSSEFSIDTIAVDMKNASLSISHTKGKNFVLSLVVDENIDKASLSEVLTELRSLMIQ